MSNLLVELFLRLANAAGAAFVGLVIYLVATGTFGATPGVELALLCWLAAAAFILLAQESPI